MIDQSEIRAFFFKKMEVLEKDKAIIDQLDELLIFNTEKQLDLELFYNKFSKIISWQVINSLPYNLNKGVNSNEVRTIINIQAWAIKSWKKGIEAADLNKIIASYLLVERLYLLPEKDLCWDLSTEKLKSYLKKFLQTMDFDVNCDLPEYVSFSDRKFHKDYEKALIENDYKGILDFLSALNRGNHFSNEFIKIITKIALFIDPQLIAESISNYSPFLTRLMIGYMDANQIVLTLSKYNDSSPLPLIIGLIVVVNPIGNNSFDNDLLNNFDYLKRASEIVEKISNRVKADNLYKFLTSCSNIFMNKLWHSIFSAYVSNRPEYLNDYVTEIDFTYDTGESSYNIVSKFSDESNLDKFSIQIYNIYIDYLVKNEGYQQHLFCFTSYYRFILRAICVISNNSFSEYLAKLEEVSVELKRGIYSWNLQTKYMLFTKWIFWILSSKQIEHNCEINKEGMTTTFELLKDTRVINALNSKIGETKIQFELLVGLLEKPESTNKIILPFGDKVIEVAWLNE